MRRIICSIRMRRQSTCLPNVYNFSVNSGTLLGPAQRTNGFGLAVRRNIAVARKRREDVLVAKILGPSLVLLGGLADLAAKKGQG
jgi:hypothetical protein